MTPIPWPAVTGGCLVGLAGGWFLGASYAIHSAWKAIR